ncbi:uncharacterized protein LOC126904750 isoform X2 [Daktulosphaira vitifoliae]|uniref:uncharacterized protein LOC126904750 isoform X2 n=1 Tax=Daktulosphaira vitifoliae TaxID=58002 RepID=UPI0021AACE52|nr:uncharacterized protein LOC126904750 isoform X2 [Daktulosphaira vitifoliae]
MAGHSKHTVKHSIIKKVINRFKKVLDEYTSRHFFCESDHTLNKSIIKKMSQFFIKKQIYFTMEINLTNKILTENNADEIKNQLEEIMQKVEIYLSDLKKSKDHLEIIARRFKVRSFKVSNYNPFIDSKVLDRICNTQSHFEIYSFITNDSNKKDIEYYKDKEDVDEDYSYYWKKITTFNLEDVKDDYDENNENDIDTNDSIEIQSTYKPLYMIDYCPYGM